MVEFTFEKHNESFIRKMINQSIMVQATITTYYHPMNSATKKVNEAKIPVTTLDDSKNDQNT